MEEKTEPVLTDLIAPASSPETEKDRFYPVFGLVFLGLLLGIMALHLILPDKAYSASEKRALAGAEILFNAPISENFADRAEEYVSDQFPLRAAAMRLKSNLMLLAGENESQGVYYCRDGSLIQAFAPYDKEQPEEMAAAINGFVLREDFRQVLFLLLPTAVSIWSEKLPAYAQTASESDFSKELTGRLSEKLIVPDCFFHMEKIKQAGIQPYYLTDHHWTTPAAKAMFHRIAPRMDWTEGEYTGGVVSDRFLGSLVSLSGFTPSKSDALTVYEGGKHNASVLVMHEAKGESRGSFYDYKALEGGDPYEVFLGGNEPLITIRTTADTDDTLLVFKDSYANCFLPFLTESYKTITVVDPRYFADPVSSLFLDSGYTDVLFLFNVQTLASDDSLRIVLEDWQ